MDTSSTTTATPSLRTKTSSTTLNPCSEQFPTREPAFIYYKSTGHAPNPDAQPKPKSMLRRLLAKLPSTTAVRRSTQMRDAQLLEEERTGVKRVVIQDLGGSATAVALTNGGHCIL